MVFTCFMGVNVKAAEVVGEVALKQISGYDDLDIYGSTVYDIRVRPNERSSGFRASVPANSFMVFWVLGAGNKYDVNVVGSTLKKSTEYTQDGESEIEAFAYVKDAGSYEVQLNMRASTATSSEEQSFRVLCGYMPAGDSTLRVGEFEYVTMNNPAKSKFTYMKVVVDKPSKLVARVYSYVNRKVYLCDKNKKLISDGSSIVAMGSKGYTVATWAVEGGTYYIRTLNDVSPMMVKATTTSVWRNGGTTKTRAKALKVGSSTSSVIKMGMTTQEDWYKITVPKAMKVSVVLEGSVTGWRSVAATSVGTKYVKSTKATLKGLSSTAVLKLNGGKTVPKGTYYVKIQGPTAKSSVSYKISVINK